MSFLATLFRRKPKPAEVAERLIAKMRTIRPELNFTYEPQQELIRTSDGVISLSNLLLEYGRAEASERPDGHPNSPTHGHLKLLHLS